MHRNFNSVTLTLLSLLLFPAITFVRAQPPVVPAGFVLSGDLILPQDAVFGDSYICAVPWIDGGRGRVPFRFSPQIGNAEAFYLRDAMAEWAAVADIEFVEHTNEPFFLVFNEVSGNVGSSMVGIMAAPFAGQPVNIPSSWMDGFAERMGIVHELGHALGMWHEQQRPDALSYVQFISRNIDPFANGNFVAIPCLAVPPIAFDTGPYDFDSVMHYSSCTFSTARAPDEPCLPPVYTIQTLDPANQRRIGQRDFLSLEDARGAARVYGAPLPPVLHSLEPANVEVSSQARTIRVLGERFLRGSSDPTRGVQGTRVLIDGAPLPVSNVRMIDVGILEATIPVAMLSSPRCLSVRVENESPGGGLSATQRTLTVARRPPLTPDDELSGERVNGRLGDALALLDDWDGDGFPEVAIGAPRDDQWTGRVVVWSPKRDRILLDLRGPAGGATRFGAALCAMRDLDGDGLKELVVGAPGGVPGRVIVYGSRAPNNILIQYISGTAAQDGFGTAVADLGDFNGDGTSDLLIGAPGQSNGIGRVHIHSGRAPGPLLQSIAPGVPGVIGFGAAIVAGLRIDADPIPDFVVGAPNSTDQTIQNTGTGQVIAYSGQTLARYWRQFGVPGSAFGAALAKTQDRDGDGREDVLVGAPLANGSQGLAAVLDSSNGIPLALLDGSSPGDLFGFSVASGQDVDHDGRDELLIGAPGASDPRGSIRNQRGLARLFSGRDLLPLRGWYGETDGELSGRTILLAPDLNGDGRPDLLAGAPEFGESSCPELGRVRIADRRVPPARRRVMLSEVGWGDRPFVELMNHDTNDWDLTDWSIVWRESGQTWTAIRLTTQIDPGERVLVTDRAGFPAPPGVVVLDRFDGQITTRTEPFSIALLDDRGRVVDALESYGAQPFGPSPPSSGGAFFGLLERTSSAPGILSFGSLERIEGQDGDSAEDWRLRSLNSAGLQNTGMGGTGIDPRPLSTSLWNEVDPVQRYAELNIGTGTINLQGHSLVLARGSSTTLTHTAPWPDPTEVRGPLLVIGTSLSPPAELPTGVDYLVVGADFGGLPLDDSAFELALYDHEGRLLDLVRATGHDDQQVIHHPRIPVADLNYLGAAQRMPLGARTIARRAVPPSFREGMDWRATYHRSMGSENGDWIGPLPEEVPLDLRIEGQDIVIRAERGSTPRAITLMLTTELTQGQGTFFGLAPSALSNWLQFGTQAPFAQTLGSDGTGRIRLGFQSTLGLAFEIRAVLHASPPFGPILGQSLIQRWEF